MSMINDALRRASDATATETLPEPSAVPPPLPPVAFPMSTEIPPLEEPARKSSLPLVLLALFLFCVAGAAGVFLWQRSHRAANAARELSAETASAVVTKLSPAAKPAQPDKTASVEKSTTAPAPSPAVAKAATPAAAPAAKSAPSTAAPAPVASAPLPNVTFPPLRLQGIYFRPPNPSVMINGRTLYVNDQVQGVTVASIDQSSVTLVLSGRTNVLTLR